jgi:diacylglycerol kinase
MKEFAIKRLKSLQYVFQGIFYLARNEAPVIVHIITSLLWVIAGFYFGITTQEWIIELICIGLVLSVEGLNTAVEKLCDFVHPERAKEIGIIKDIAAGAVGFAVIPVTIVLGIIYYPYILKLF